MTSVDAETHTTWHKHSDRKERQQLLPCVNLTSVKVYLSHSYSFFFSKIQNRGLQIPHSCTGKDSGAVVSLFSEQPHLLCRKISAVLIAVRPLYSALRHLKSSRTTLFRLEEGSLYAIGLLHHHHHHQFILETQNMTMSENTEQNNKTCAPRVRKAATALTTAHVTKSSTV